MQVLFPAAFIVQQIVAVPFHWFLARKSYIFNENEGKLAYLRRKTLFFLLPFLLFHVSIAFRQPPPLPDFNCFSYSSTYTLSTVYRATSTLHVSFLKQQLHLSGVPNLEMALGAKGTKLGPCAKHPACILLGLMRNDRGARCDGEF